MPLNTPLYVWFLPSTVKADSLQFMQISFKGRSLGLSLRALDLFTTEDFLISCRALCDCLEP